MATFEKGDAVRYIATPAQTGTVSRLKPLKVQDSMVITWDQGPMYTAGEKTALFGEACLLVELVP